MHGLKVGVGENRNLISMVFAEFSALHAERWNLMRLSDISVCPQKGKAMGRKNLRRNQDEQSLKNMNRYSTSRQLEIQHMARHMDSARMEHEEGQRFAVSL